MRGFFGGDDKACAEELNAAAMTFGLSTSLRSLADASVLAPLRDMLTATYQRLDPLLPVEGAFLSRWRLQLNVTPRALD